jgi:prepilin-type N-terminal cleavage/methylation domain-containing protein/prepilin-type processing-associated H-X9-DG protein
MHPYTGRMSNRNRTEIRGFTLIEALVVLAVIAVLLAILLPALERAREQANTLKCGANLAQIGVSLLAYANDNHGQFPRTVYDPAAPVVFGTNAAAVDPFKPGGPAANDVTAALFLLMRTRRFPAILFVEPYNDEIEDSPDPAADPGSRSNFTDYRKNLGYSYANPYPSTAAIAAGFQFNSRMNPAFAVAGDLNPGVPGKNSRNHEGRGQNVLFADFHVQWETTTACGVAGDDIYTNKAGAIMASPIDAGDSVLLPTDK